MISEKRLLLPINLGRVIRSFPNYLESIILQRERLFTSGKHSGQLSIFPGVDVPASSPQGEKLKTLQIASNMLSEASAKNHKTSGTMSFGQKALKWRGLVNSTIFGENQTQHISTNSSYQLSSTVVEGWWSGLVLQPQDLGTLQSTQWMKYAPSSFLFFCHQSCYETPGRSENPCVSRVSETLES